MLQRARSLARAEAQARDVPRSRVLKDEALYDIATHTPRTKADLGSLRTLHNGLAEGCAASPCSTRSPTGSTRPKSIRRSSPPRRWRRAQAVVDLLLVLLKATAGRHGVAQKLVATTADLEAIAVCRRAARFRCFSGWRRKVFGEDALALKHGELSLAIERGAVSVRPTKAEPA